MTTWIRIGLRTWFVLSIAVCVLGDAPFAAAACGFWWLMTEI
jgi:hypothetical protein